MGDAGRQLTDGGKLVGLSDLFFHQAALLDVANQQVESAPGAGGPMVETAADQGPDGSAVLAPQRNFDI